MDTLTRNNDAALIPIGVAGLFLSFSMIGAGYLLDPMDEPASQSRTTQSDSALASAQTSPAVDRSSLENQASLTRSKNRAEPPPGLQLSASYPQGADHEHEQEIAASEHRADCTGAPLEGAQTGTGACSSDPNVPKLKMHFGVKTVFHYWDNVPGTTHYRLLQNYPGTDEFVQMGEDIPPEHLSIPPLGDDITGALYDIAPFRHDGSKSLFRVEACRGEQCVASEPVSLAKRLQEAVGYFKASNTAAHDRFGRAVALSRDGKTLAIGAPLKDNIYTGAADADIGVVYVFARDEGDVWRQQQAMTLNIGGGDGVWIGTSVALSDDGNTLAVGASGGELVYVFSRRGNRWSSRPFHVKAPSRRSYGRFGHSVALSGDGNTLVVGSPGLAPSATNPGTHNLDRYWPGAVHLYSRDINGWHHRARLETPNTLAGDYFASALALSEDGKTLAVGAPEENDQAVQSAGAVYVYKGQGEEWVRTARIAAPHPGPGYRFGGALALSGDGQLMAVGADGENAGAAYIYKSDDSRWAEPVRLQTPGGEDADGFGSSIALAGDGQVLAVGAPCEDSGSRGLNGEPADNTAACSGAAYAYVMDDEQHWQKRSYLKAPNADAGDRFGDVLALSADGDTLAIGAPSEDGSGSGLHGDMKDNSAEDAGAVYLF
jgi:hypothetical protein